MRLHLNDSPLESRDEHVRERGEGGFTNLEVSQILESDIALLMGVARKGFYPAQEYAAKISGTNFIPATREHMWERYEGFPRSMIRG